ncbi:hypothetical protein BKA70DRAFT_1463484 [Coprinopsis sp. MPI-PUGE-AT-0042]|nr:hypothetical protein BKA70DRAFT_1463484 [Coprinopsis sp. MPI-PUGE-AT-0042]
MVGFALKLELQKEVRIDGGSESRAAVGAFEPNDDVRPCFLGRRGNELEMGLNEGARSPFKGVDCDVGVRIDLVAGRACTSGGAGRVGLLADGFDLNTPLFPLPSSPSFSLGVDAAPSHSPSHPEIRRSEPSKHAFVPKAICNLQSQSTARVQFSAIIGGFEVCVAFVLGTRPRRCERWWYSGVDVTIPISTSSALFLETAQSSPCATVSASRATPSEEFRSTLLTLREDVPFKETSDFDWRSLSRVRFVVHDTEGEMNAPRRPMYNSIEQDLYLALQALFSRPKTRYPRLLIISVGSSSPLRTGTRCIGLVIVGLTVSCCHSLVVVLILYSVDIDGGICIDLSGEWQGPTTTRKDRNKDKKGLNKEWPGEEPSVLTPFMAPKRGQLTLEIRANVRYKNIEKE